MINFNTTLNTESYNNLRYDLLRAEEGFETMPYLDSKGIPTIGVGVNLRAYLDGVVLKVFYPNSNIETIQLYDTDYVAQFQTAVSATYANNEDLCNALNNILATRNANTSYEGEKRSTFSITASESKDLFDVIIEEKETTVVNNWLAGIPKSSERAALVALAYNNPSLLGYKLKDAIQSGNRAEAWYEIRYQSNGGTSSSGGIAKRRYAESELFGLYNNPNNITTDEINNITQMITLHGDAIDTYERVYGEYKTGTSNKVTAAENDYDMSVSSLKEALTPYVMACYGVNPTNFQILQLVQGYTNLISGKGRDLLLGGNSEDVAKGGNGSDTLIGGKGNDYLEGGNDSDIYKFNPGDGIDKVYDIKGNNDTLSFNANIEDYYPVQFGSDLFIVRKSGGDVVRVINHFSDNSIENVSFYNATVSGDIIANWPGEEEPGNPSNPNDPNNPYSLPNLGDFSPYSDIAEAVLADLKRDYGSAEMAPVPRGEPLVLDLDGDGVETVGINAGIYYDHNNNGFAELTGFVSADDGLLVRDINNDGQITGGAELFGNNTALSGGGNASNGFTALADLDSNNDGIVNNLDTAYSELKVWRDLDQDGDADTGELFTLSEVGVAGINTGYTNQNITDENNNKHSQAGTFVRDDGTTGAVEDVWFIVDSAKTIDTTEVVINEEIMEMPNAFAFGNVHDLRTAMALDTTGELQALVEDYASENDSAVRDVILTNLIYTWAGAEDVDPASRGGIVDARKLITLEALMGDAYLQSGSPNPIPNSNAVALLLAAFETFKNFVDVQLLEQTHYQDLMEEISLTWNDSTNSFDIDVSSVVASLQARYNTNETEGICAIDGMTRILKSYSDIGEQALQAICKNGDANSSGFSFYLAKMDSLIGDNTGNTLTDSNGNDIIFGLGGDDDIHGGNGNNVLDGGLGSDILQGSAGNDTYRFGLGYGMDTIYETSGSDVIELRPNVTPSDVTLERHMYDLHVKLTDGSKIVVNEWYSSTNNKVETLRFANGVDADIDLMTEAYTLTFSGTSGDDTLIGEDVSETICGLGGNDVIVAGHGNNTITTGSGTDDIGAGNGNNIINAGGGSNYIYVGSGNNSITTGSGVDNIQVGDGDNTIISGSGDDIIIAGNGSNNISSVSGYNQITAGYGDNTINTGIGDDIIQVGNGNNIINAGAGYNSIVAGNGNNTITTTSGADYVEVGNGNNTINAGVGDDIINVGTGTNLVNGESGNDCITIIGNSNSTIDGGAGNDTLEGNIGNDTLIGGTGADILRGGAGNDAIYFDVYDTEINGGEGIDTAYAQGTSGVTLDLLSASVEIAYGTIARDVLDASWDTTPVSIYGNGGNDTITGGSGNDYLQGDAGNDALNGGLGNDILIGGDGNDTLKGNEGDDILDGGIGDDILQGGAGNDIYRFGFGYGTDTLTEASENDTIELNSDVSISDVSLERRVYDLYVKLSDGSALVVKNWYNTSSTNYKVETLSFTNGIDANINLMTEAYNIPGYGTENAETITGEAAGMRINGLGGNDTLNGAAGNDVLEGGADNDTLRGYAGDDILDGGVGNDVVQGGVGNDTYRFGVGSGIDTLTEASGTDGIHIVGGLIPSDISIARNVNNMRISINGTSDYIDIVNQYSTNTNYRVEQITFDDGSILNIGDLTNLPQFGTSGDDTLTGNTQNNNIVGAAGNDTITGGTGNDTLYGGSGNDTYLFGRGDGVDNINNQDADGLDVISISNADYDELWFSQQGQNLKVSIMGTNDAVTVNNWFNNAESKVDKVWTADNFELDKTSVDLLVQAMSAFNPEGSSSISENETLLAALNPTLQQTWHAKSA